jgi:hypothetical protein
MAQPPPPYQLPFKETASRGFADESRVTAKKMNAPMHNAAAAPARRIPCPRLPSHSMMARA